MVNFLLVAARSKLAFVRAILAFARSLIDYARASMVSLFTVSANVRVSNDWPNFSTISTQIVSSIFSFLMAEFAVNTDSLVVSLVILDTSVSAARKYFFPSFQPRSVRLFFYRLAYFVLIIPVDLTWVCS